jgi:hypothetical protein
MREQLLVRRRRPPHVYATATTTESPLKPLIFVSLALVLVLVLALVLTED